MPRQTNGFGTRELMAARDVRRDARAGSSSSVLLIHGLLIDVRKLTIARPFAPRNEEGTIRLALPKTRNYHNGQRLVWLPGTFSRSIPIRFAGEGMLKQWRARCH